MSEDAPDGYENYVAFKKWDRLFAYTPDEAAYFAGETRDVAISGADVLEIGFGSGAFLAWARDRGARVAGVDIIPALQDAARRAGVELLPSDLAEAARQNEGRFDTIVALDVFEHFSREELLAALDAAARLLREGGSLMLRFPNAQSPFGLAPQYGDPTHRIALSADAFDYFIQRRPFEIARYGGVYRIGGGSPAKRLLRALRRLAQRGVELALNAVYAQNIPWDPVATLVLRRVPEPAAGAKSG